jgi:hypothetical protein
MPRPWRVKALRSDGQLVPSSAAAALTLPSSSASAKARSASVRSARKRLGCQPTQRSSMVTPQCLCCSTRYDSDTFSLANVQVMADSVVELRR